MRISNMVTLLRFLWIFILFFYTEASQVIHLRVEEESSLHTTIGNISAHLLPNSKVIIDQPFFTATSTGMIQVARRLDLEALCSEHSLCCARDRPCDLTSNVFIESESSKDIATLELIVRVTDVNDHAPKFPGDHNRADMDQVVKISELAEVGTLLDLIPATDNDVSQENQVKRYALRGSKLQRMFELEHSHPPSVGLRLLQRLDYEVTQNYSGSLEACDVQKCIQQNLTVLVIDANDNKPVFLKHSYEVKLPENMSVGETVLSLLATDKDSLSNAQMDFHFHGAVDPNIKKTFRLEKHSGKLVLQSRLGAHQRSEYRFSVGVGESIASDGAGSMTEGTSSILQSPSAIGSTDIAKVVITVEDLNDFSPVIKMISPSEEQSLVIRENSGPMRIAVYQVTDNDLDDNGRVHCHLIPSLSAGTGDTVDLFQLVSRGTLYTLSTTKSFDAEVRPQLSVTIVCTDFGKPPRSSSRDLTIQVEDINEFQPQVEQTTYSASVMENTKAGVEVIQITARDRDHNSQLVYELSSEGQQYFAINKSTGVITTLGETVEATGALRQHERPNLLTSNSLLDREKTARITFKVCVTDGQPSMPCGIVATETQPTGGESLIKQSNGVVHTAYSTVFVTVLDENDNPPKFISTGPFSVMENQPRFTKISGRLAAIDPDDGENGQVRYSLRQVWISANGQPTSDLFQVDAEGGIRTMDVLDRELTNAYTLALVACDSAPQEPLCTSLNATVAVLDENDNPPEWHYPHDQDNEVNITTDLPPGHVIARVLALDGDAGDNGHVIYSLIDPHRRTVFQVDNITGEVAVTRNDKTTDPSRADVSVKSPPGNSNHDNPLLPGVYRLRLKASDLGHPVQAAETWLQVNVFGSESTAGASVNLFIIIIMISVTGVISACLVVAIICVRRRSSTYRSQRRSQQHHHHQHNGTRRSRGDGAEGGSTYPLKHEYGYPLDGAGYVVMGVSPTPSDLGAIKLNSYHQVMPNGLQLLPNGASGHEPIPLLAGTSWATTNPDHSAHCHHAPVGVDSNVGLSLLACANHSDHMDCAASTSYNLPIYLPSALTSSDSNVMPVAGTLMRSPPTTSNFPVSQILHHHSPNTQQLLATSSSNNCLRFSSPSPAPPFSALQSFGNATEDTGDGRRCDPPYPSSSTAGLGTNTNFVPSMDVLHGPCGHDMTTLAARSGFIMHPNPSVCCHPSSRRYITTGGHPPQVSVCELDVDSADSGRGTSEDDPGQLGHHIMHFYPNLRLPHNNSLYINSSANTVVSDCDGTTVMGNDGNSSVEWSSTDRPRLKC